jgi:hypothetical protein
MIILFLRWDHDFRDGLRPRLPGASAPMGAGWRHAVAPPPWDGRARSARSHTGDLNPSQPWPHWTTQDPLLSAAALARWGTASALFRPFCKVFVLLRNFESFTWDCVSSITPAMLRASIRQL